MIQAPRFDSIYPGVKPVNGRVPFIGFDINKKSGMLDSHDKQLIDAVYDEIYSNIDPHASGGLLIAKKGGKAGSST